MNEIEAEETVQRLKREFDQNFKPPKPQHRPDLLTLTQAAQQLAEQHGLAITPDEVQGMLERYTVARLYARKVGDVWRVPVQDLPTLRWYVKRLLGK